jgi:hypothetical protein
MISRFLKSSVPNSTLGQSAENGKRIEKHLFFLQRYDNMNMYFITGNFPEKEKI